MQGQVVELKGQREALLMEIKHLKDDMQAASAQGESAGIHASGLPHVTESQQCFARQKLSHRQQAACKTS